MFARSRRVSHGNPLCGTPPRTKAHRRSPASPCQDTSVSTKASALIDLTGYRHNPTTRPTGRASRGDSVMFIARSLWKMGFATVGHQFRHGRVARVLDKLRAEFF